MSFLHHGLFRVTGDARVPECRGDSSEEAGHENEGQSPTDNLGTFLVQPRRDALKHLDLLLRGHGSRRRTATASSRDHACERACTCGSLHVLRRVFLSATVRSGFRSFLSVRPPQRGMMRTEAQCDTEWWSARYGLRKVMSRSIEGMPEYARPLSGGVRREKFLKRYRPVSTNDREGPAQLRSPS